MTLDNHSSLFLSQHLFTGECTSIIFITKFSTLFLTKCNEMIDSKGDHQSIKVEGSINDASHYFPTYEQSQTGHWKIEAVLNEK